MAQGKWQSDAMGAGCKQHPQTGRNVACVNNCGFFGSETTLHMCANCYRSYLSSTRAGAASESTSTSAASPAPAEGSSTPSTVSTVVDTTPLAAQGSGAMEEEPQAHEEACPAPFAPGPMEGFPRARSDASAMGRGAEHEEHKLGEAPSSSSSLPCISDDTMPLGPTEPAVEAADEDCEGADCLVRSDACRAMDIVKGPELVEAFVAPAGHPLLMPARAAPAPILKSAHKPSRCQACRKKVGLTGFRCRCNGLFCGTHRYWDQHSCTFDYKTAERESIARANPVVIADKIVRF